LGKLYQERVSVTLSNNTTKTITLTVPSGKRWKVYAASMTNGDDVARTLDLYVYDGSNNVIHRLGHDSDTPASEAREMLGHVPANAADVSSNAAMAGGGAVLKAGNKLALVWWAGGASSGGTSYYCVTYEEMVE